MAESRVRAVLVNKKSFLSCDYFVTNNDKSIRYLNDGKVWFSIGDITEAIGYGNYTWNVIRNKLIKDVHITKAILGNSGRYMWFCDIEGVHQMLNATERWAYSTKSERNCVYELCNAFLNSNKAKKHEVEEVNEEMTNEIPELTAIHKGKFEVGAIVVNGEVHYFGTDIIKILTNKSFNISSELSKCNISREHYVKITCVFRGYKQERILIDKFAVNKIIDRYLNQNPDLGKYIRQWLCEELVPVEAKEIIESGNIKNKGLTSQNTSGIDFYYDGFLDGFTILKDPKTAKEKLVKAVAQKMNALLEDGSDDATLKIAKMLEAIR